MIKDSLLIIPAYNEGQDIERVLAAVQDKSPDLDILIVDDGSTDNTAKAAKKQGARVISLPLNMGYGSALEAGYKYANKKGYQYILQMDADGQHEPSFLGDLLRVVKGGQADLVIGSRFLDKENYQAPFARKMGMIIFSKITSWLIGQTITDSTSGFQAMNKNVVKFFVNGFYPADYPDADVLIILKRAGFRLAEISVIMYSKQSKKSMHAGLLKPVYYIFKMFLSIGMIFLRPQQKL